MQIRQGKNGINDKDQIYAMSQVKIVDLKESILQNNDQDAEKLRQELKDRKICLVNVMSSPGSGKTTTLLALNRCIKNRIRFGVMEA